MTTKPLNSRQARWAELLADKNFLINYRSGNQNSLADALTRLANEVNTQNSVKKNQRLQTLIQDNQVDPAILLARELRQDTLEETLINSPDQLPRPLNFTIVDQCQRLAG